MSLSVYLKRSSGNKGNAGFTLVELMTVIVIILILAALLIPAISAWKGRTEKARCISNLRGLYLGAANYIQQVGYWPQVSTGLLKTHQYDAAWIETLRPYGLANENWICPTQQRNMGNPEYNTAKTARADYMATPFPQDHHTPYRWPTQPWFAEKGDFHGTGNLMIFSDGSIDDLKHVKLRMGMYNPNQ